MATAICSSEHRESNQCSAVQQAVASHCTYHCGTCDVTITDDILGDCEVAAPDGVAVRAADQIVDDCTANTFDVWYNLLQIIPQRNYTLLNRILLLLQFLSGRWPLILLLISPSTTHNAVLL